MKSILLGVLLLFGISLIMTQFKGSRKYMAKGIAKNDILKEISNSDNPAETLMLLRQKEQMFLAAAEQAKNESLAIQPKIVEIEMAEARIEVIDSLLKKFK